MLKPEEVRARRENIVAARDRAAEKKNAALDRARQIHNDAIVEYDAAVQSIDRAERELQAECPHAKGLVGRCPDCGK